MFVEYNFQTETVLIDCRVNLPGSERGPSAAASENSPRAPCRDVTPINLPS